MRLNVQQDIISKDVMPVKVLSAHCQSEKRGNQDQDDLSQN